MGEVLTPCCLFTPRISTLRSVSSSEPETDWRHHDQRQLERYISFSDNVYQ
jgi:hypothetical protein